MNGKRETMEEVKKKKAEALAFFFLFIFFKFKERWKEKKHWNKEREIKKGLLKSYKFIFLKKKQERKHRKRRTLIIKITKEK